MNTLIVNVLLSTLIFYLAYRWMLSPVLFDIKPHIILTPLLLLHALRHLGLMFLTTGVTATDMPWQFAIPAAAGDFLSAMLALFAVTLIQRKSAWAVAAAWVFSIVGTIDFVGAITLSRIFRAADYLGGAYWIPAFWVPMFLIAHWIIWRVLLRMKRDGRDFQSEYNHAHTTPRI
jgi:hypothetical protein